VLMMSSLTDRMFQTAVDGLLNRDSHLCCQVIADDAEIDLLEKKVDVDGINLLVRFQPVASDMRQVVSAMKISTSLERIADLSVTVARRAAIRFPVAGPRQWKKSESKSYQTSSIWGRP